MDADESRPVVRRPRKVARAVLPAGPERELREVMYRLYAEADYPRLEDLAVMIAADDDLDGSPKRDLIAKIIGGGGLASQQDTVTVAVALARTVGREQIAVVARQVRELWLAAQTTAQPVPPVRLGRPVRDCDPLMLEVHRAIDVPGQRSNGSMPAYVVRNHDERLRQAADRVMDGTSELVTLVGGSSTGKTRACWELAQHLDRQQPSRWWLWHPYDPTRPEAASRALSQVGAHTIVWLNEAQHYLITADPSLGERIAAGLRTLLQDPDRRPTLVLATLWPQYWSALTTRPAAGEQDPHAQARDLLTGTAITVADTFTPDELDGLDGPEVDARLRQAADHAEAGRITQYLAGAPELENRYRTAGPAARAIIQVAMDARRLGHPLALPQTLLEQAAPGYLDDHDWDHLGEDWLEQALAYTARPCKGARGPLTRIRPRPGEDRTQGGPSYRLADYLEQTGHVTRAEAFPPAAFWNAIAATAEPDVLLSIGNKAHQRGRYHRAGQLYRQAADRGNLFALWRLAQLKGQAGDITGAEGLYQRAAERGDTNAMRALARLREKAGNHAAAVTLAVEAADRGDPFALTELAALRIEAGDIVGAEAIAVIKADRGDTSLLLELAELRQQIGDWARSEAAYRQAADRDDVFALQQVVWLRTVFADWDGAEAIAVRAADRGDISALLTLASVRDVAGEHAEAESLYQRAAQYGNAEPLLRLAQLRERASDTAGAETLYGQAADHGNADALACLAKLRQNAGDVASAEDLYRDAAAHGHAYALHRLAELKVQTGDVAEADVLYSQAAARGDVIALRRVVELRERAGDRVGAENAALQTAGIRDNIGVLEYLVDLREEAGDGESAEAVAMQAANQGNTAALRHLAWRRGKASDVGGAESLYRQADSLGDTLALRHLAMLREETGDTSDADALYSQAGDRGDTYALERLATLRQQTGDTVGAMNAALRAADGDKLDPLRSLGRLREKAGDWRGAEDLYWLAVHRGDAQALWSLAQLWNQTDKADDAADLRRFGLTDEGIPARILDI